ncbi:MAG: hypothetical protein K2W96_03035, partial [Gemmataceae bacterium]|nr:hypothetical protein [Gemmataceae bacterium]
ETRGLERFIAAHRKPPLGEAAAIPPVDEDEVRAILRARRMEEWETEPPQPLDRFADTEPPEEQERQRSEAAWLSLLFDTRG